MPELCAFEIHLFTRNEWRDFEIPLVWTVENLTSVPGWLKSKLTTSVLHSATAPIGIFVRTHQFLEPIELLGLKLDLVHLIGPALLKKLNSSNHRFLDEFLRTYLRGAESSSVQAILPKRLLKIRKIRGRVDLRTRFQIYRDLYKIFCSQFGNYAVRPNLNLLALCLFFWWWGYPFLK